MEVSDHSLPQITPEVLKKLSLDELLQLTIKLLKDLKEARDRLNQNSNNSSRPSSSMAPWEKNSSPDEDINEGTENNTNILDLDLEKIKAEDDKTGHTSTIASDAQDSDTQTVENTNTENADPANKIEDKSRKKSGKQKGDTGYGRTWNPDVTEEPVHCAVENCAVCSHLLNPVNNIPYTRYNQVDIQLGNELLPGLVVIVTPYILYQNSCDNCGHENRYDPKSSLIVDAIVWGDAELSEWRWIGPNLASFIIHLKMEFRLPIRKIRDLLNYLGIPLSIGVIQQCYEEGGIAVAPLEEALLDQLIKEALIHADETIWLEKANTLWLWIFVATTVVYMCVGPRTKKMLEGVLRGSFAGWLMTDGYGAYRYYEKRLRCWAHLLRKAQGLADSTDAQAIEFGNMALTFMKTVMTAIYEWRKNYHQVTEKTDDLMNSLKDILGEFNQACARYGGDATIHEKTKALAREFLNDWSAIFRILEHPYLPLTNNEAERGLRPWVLLRKICYGSKSVRGTKTFAMLASIIQTCRKRGVPSMRFIAETISFARKGEPILMPA